MEPACASLPQCSLSVGKAGFLTEHTMSPTVSTKSPGSSLSPTVSAPHRGTGSGLDMLGCPPPLTSIKM